MANTKLSYYLQKFQCLRTSRGNTWTLATKSQAPHKPILLLSVLDLFAQGHITTNMIEITPELGELFATYWSNVMPPEHRGNLALPFFHLRSSGFWHLMPQPGKEITLEITRQADTLYQLGHLVVGARLDEELYSLLQIADSRNALRTILIQTYFAPEFSSTLLELGEINLQSFIYSQHLIEQARKQLNETFEKDDSYRPIVRDQGFHRAVVRIYDHRCAFCGIRMLTSDGHTAVDAAHIIPWSISHNDDPHNGIALCGLCHWAFDQGLLGISTKYLLLLSSELRITQNIPGHLLNLESRSIIGPFEQDLWPYPNSLEWHRQNIYRQG